MAFSNYPLKSQSKSTDSENVIHHLVVCQKEACAEQNQMAWKFLLFIVLTEHCRISQNYTGGHMRSKPSLHGLRQRGCSSPRTQTVECPGRSTPSAYKGFAQTKSVNSEKLAARNTEHYAYLVNSNRLAYVVHI